MTDETLISYAQNGEDVVLWRALQHLDHGVYVDVGGWDPDQDSVTRLFYERGWRGVSVEPVPDFAEKFRVRRPRDQVIEAVITDADVESVVLHRFGDSGLSTLDDDFAAQHSRSGLESDDITVRARRLDEVLEEADVVAGAIQFLKIDVEGAEAQVLRTADLTHWRPWVLVIEATEPNSTTSSHEAWEAMVLDAGYTFTLFDGLSRYYVSAEHPELREALSYPACIIDNFKRAEQAIVEGQLQLAQARVAETAGEVQAWRNRAVEYWADAVAKAQELETTLRVATRRAERLEKQLSKLRGRLRTSQEERRRLRERSERLGARVQRLQKRVERQDQLFEVRTRNEANRVIDKVRGS